MITTAKVEGSLVDSNGTEINSGTNYVNTLGGTGTNGTGTLTFSPSEVLIGSEIDEKEGTIALIYEIGLNSVYYTITNNLGQITYPSKKFKKKVYKAQKNKLVLVKEIEGSNDPNKVYFDDKSEYARKS